MICTKARLARNTAAVSDARADAVYARFSGSRMWGWSGASRPMESRYSRSPTPDSNSSMRTKRSSTTSSTASPIQIDQVLTDPMPEVTRLVGQLLNKKAESQRTKY